MPVMMMQRSLPIAAFDTGTGALKQGGAFSSDRFEQGQLVGRQSGQPPPRRIEEGDQLGGGLLQALTLLAVGGLRGHPTPI